MDSRLKLPLLEKGPRRRKLVYTGIAIFIMALAIDGVFGANGWVATYRLKLQARQEQQSIQQIKKQNQQLSNEVRSLKTNPMAVERIAREKMGLVKPGELVFKLPPNSSAPTGPASGSSGAGGTSATVPATPPQQHR